MTGRFHDHRIDSHFQPIYRLAHGRAVGWEALMRGIDPSGRPEMPPAILSIPRNDRERGPLDCRSRAVHVDNFLGAGPTAGRLLLNVQPETFLQGPSEGTFFEDLLSSRQLPHHRVALEVLEDAIRDRDRIDDAAQFYRDHGCLVAIDDFGAGHSNFDRARSKRPDLVKLDQQMLFRASQAPRIRRSMPSMRHEAGALVPMEGMETEEQAPATESGIWGMPPGSTGRDDPTSGARSSIRGGCRSPPPICPWLPRSPASRFPFSCDSPTVNCSCSAGTSQTPDQPRRSTSMGVARSRPAVPSIPASTTPAMPMTGPAIHSHGSGV